MSGRLLPTASEPLPRLTSTRDARAQTGTVRRGSGSKPERTDRTAPEMLPVLRFPGMHALQSGRFSHALVGKFATDGDTFRPRHPLQGAFHQGPGLARGGMQEGV